MKVLSLKQPFAELVISGIKTIELRTWNTHYRGELYIHASGQPDKKAMENFRFATLPTSQIIGKVQLVDVKKYENETEHKADRYKHLADTTWGNFGFIFEDAQSIDPIPAKGKLGIWNYGDN